MRRGKETLNIKKRQRHWNSILRDLNRSLWHDGLWKGRFYAHQVDRRLQIEGQYLYGTIAVEFVDRETGKHVVHYFRISELEFTGLPLWEAMNDFIVVYCHAWDTEPRITRATTIDYRGCHKW